MHFANPHALWLGLVLALAIGAREKFRPLFRATLPFPDLTAAQRLPPSWRSRFARLPAFLVYAALALAIVALARPRVLLKAEEVRARGIDIMICLDTSGSMRALDFDPMDRMGAAKRAAKNFILRREFDRIGLVAFGGVAILQCPLTLDYAALLTFLDDVDVGITSTENTAVGTAIATSCNHLKKSTAKSKVIILVTDGRSNAGEVDPITAAKAADALGIRIYTIGVGVRGPSVVPVQDPLFGRRLVQIQEELDEPTLQEVARATSGHYYRATSAKELDTIYAQIDALEKSDIQGASPQEFRDLYRGWLWAAMILMTAGLGLTMTLWRVSLN